MPNESTSKINIDINGLKKNIQEANRLMRVANSEFKATSATMDNWAKSADGIGAKLTQLGKVLKSQNTILDSLEAQYKAVAEAEGESSKGAQELLIKINNQKAAIANTQKEIKKWENNLENLNNELDDGEKNLDDFDKATKDAKDGVKDLGDGFTVLKGAMANLLAEGIKNVISGFANLANETREYRAEMAKLKTAFDEGGFSAETATDTYKDFYAVLGDEGQAVEAVNHLAKMVDSEKDLATWTDIATGAYATFGDSLPIEGLTEAANETAKVGKVTGPLADALNWAGVSEDKFNESLEKCNSEQERQKLIMDTLNGLYGDAADKYRENNKEVMAANEAQAELTESYAALGAKAEPIITTIKQGMADLLTAILGLVDGVDFSKISNGVKEGFAYLIDTVLPKIKDGFTWLKDNWTYVEAGIMAIVAGFIAWKAVGVATMIQGMITKLIALVAAQEGATVAQKLLNLAMKANLIGIVITAIVALVAAFVTLWKKSESFRNFWIGLWNKIKETAKNAKDAIAKFFVELWDTITKKWQGITSWFSEKWQGIKNGAKELKENVVNFFKDAWNGVTDTWDKVTGYFKEKWQSIKDTFSNVKQWFGDTFAAAWQAIKDKFASWGEFWSGLWTKVKDKFSDIGSSIGSAISDAVVSGINGIISTIENTLNKGINLINGAIDIINKAPGVDIGHVNQLSLPRLERGGVLKRGQVGLLEGKGAEAVIPLDRNKRYLQSQAKGLLAEMNKQGGGKTNVPVTGGTTNNFTQNIYSPKALRRIDIYRQTKNQLNFAKGV